MLDPFYFYRQRALSSRKEKEKCSDKGIEVPTEGKGQILYFLK